MARFLPLLLVLSCKGGTDTADTAGPGYVPDLTCPGAAGCANADGTLQAGAATVNIVPACYETWDDLNDNHTYGRDNDTFQDCGCDQLCDGDPGYPGPDEGEGDDVFQSSWMAGFQTSRAAMGVRPAGTGLLDYAEGDGLWARAGVFRKGDSTLAIVTVDTVGWFYEPGVARTREIVAERGLDVDLIVMHALHNHEGPDTMGIWGPNIVTTGVNPDYIEQICQASADAIEQALTGITDVASMTVGTVDSTPYSPAGTRGIVNDTRDPYVVDERVGGARFVDGSGNTIVSITSFGNHPEALSDDNNYFTADFVHAARKSVEQGIHFNTFDKDGVGGTNLFINSTVGGMMTPLRINFTDYDGGEHGSGTFEKADTIGARIAEIALDAMTTEGEVVDDPALAFRSKEIWLPVVNLGFQAMFLQGVLDRPIYNYDETQPIDDDNRPDVLTEIAVIEIGPLQMVTVPGELLPENLIGGYDGSHINTPGVELFETDNPNPPDIANAPEGPYLIDHFTAPTHKWVIGMGQDELGYIIPPYNFELHPSAGYILEAEGDHYEETNSLGPDTADIVLEEARMLLQYGAE